MIPSLRKIACAALAVFAVPVTARPSQPTLNPLLPRDVTESRDLAAKASAENSHAGRHLATTSADTELVDNFLDALRVLQDEYFQPWLGTWPKAIDWTAAVMGTHVAGALSSISHGLASEEDDDIQTKENLITTYFSHLLSYYFGQDAFAIRNEAYDDILWVVLGWLELIEFVDYHTTVYHRSIDRKRDVAGGSVGPKQDISEVLRNQSWYGNVWIPAFSHRARIFWDLSSHGWNDTLCGGGMVWNPRLEPYKNAITNELYIAASISMYLYFPGDRNPSPFINAKDPNESQDAGTTGVNEAHELKHLHAALAGYFWLQKSGMMDSQGLYTDGFHIRGWNNKSNPNTHCDSRNDMVYTYNQGVILTGQIGLWKVTGNIRFLKDGHRLIQSVIKATGYDLVRDTPLDNISELRPGQLSPWHGIGRAGVLEEQCDITGRCSQDSQTFKGIFFHHLTTFCAPLDLAVTLKGDHTVQPDAHIVDHHRDACASYLGWIRHNAVAALGTKNAQGQFGMWWTVGLLKTRTFPADFAQPNPPSGNYSVDYRTFGVPNDSIWVTEPAHTGPAPIEDLLSDDRDQVPLTSPRTEHTAAGQQDKVDEITNKHERRADESLVFDPNTRGRGRTVETQGGGLAVLRSLWEITSSTKK